jgi:DNA-binding SARP family transcriptional activator/Leucine-rich repeat (LRR) protein
MSRERFLMSPVVGSIFSYLTREPYLERKLDVNGTEARGEGCNLLCRMFFGMMKVSLRWMMDRSVSNLDELSLTLLGTFQIRLNQGPIEGIASDKIRGLLAYLVVESDRPHRRSSLAEMFWPNRPSGVGRRNLKQAIANLRKVLGDRDTSTPYLLVTRDRIQFNVSSPYRLDVEAFIEAVQVSMNHGHPQLGTCETCRKNISRAVELYGGDFLAEFFLPGCQEFEEWAAIRREAFRRQMANALRLIIQYYEERDDLKEARGYGRSLVNLEPWNEGNHRLLIRLQASSGKRSEALRQYQACQRVLAEEFGVEPSKETRALYEEIRLGTFERVSTSLEQPSEDDLITPDTELRSPSIRLGESIRSLPKWVLPLSAILVMGVVMLSISLLPSLRRATPATSFTEMPSSQTDEVSITATPDLSAAPVYPSSEREILETLYRSTEGENWTVSDGWLTDDTPCDWYGVTCYTGSVSEIHLSGNQLAGAIPEALAGLSNLTVLDLNDNHLTGAIPSEIGNLASLEFLDLSFNQLSGEIPSEIVNIEGLMVLKLDGNSYLGGPIPPELGNLIAMDHLVLSSSAGGTQLSGIIPAELGNLSRLTWLEISNTLVEGPIPPELGNLTRLQYLDLSGNRLSGTIPPELGGLANLWGLSIGEGRNHLSGALPMSFMQLKKLSYLQYQQTEICEPADLAFQAWLETIPDLYRTGILCPEEED